MRKTLIIAEAGVNHNGSLELAKELIDVAAEMKVDYVKFQTFKTESLITKTAKLADYQQQNIKSNISQYSMLKKLELTEEQHVDLIEYCNLKGVKFLSTAFDFESLRFLNSLKLGIWKIPSGEITNYPYLKYIAQRKQQVILSTGMSDLEDIRSAMKVFQENGLCKEQITILHCNTEYPTPMQDVNLLAIPKMQEEFGTNVGYSDHTKGIEVSIAAVALGATLIEKHFTLDRNMEGPDHKASLEPHELKAMVEAIRNVEISLGVRDKIVTKSELKNRDIARKSIVALKTIKEGDLLTEENITVKRPGNGLSPMLWEKVLKSKAIKDFQPDEFIQL